MTSEIPDTSGYEQEQEAVRPAISDSVGTCLNRAGRRRRLTSDEEIQLAKLAQQGDTAARDILIENNLQLVVSIARRHVQSGVPLPDLIQEGSIGLIKAVERFDYRRGFRFSTYAVRWIAQSITRAVECQRRTIRVPCYVLQMLRNLGRLGRVMSAEMGREPTFDELAARANMTSEAIAHLKQNSELLVSLDAEGPGEETAPLLERIESEVASDPLNEAILMERAFLIERLMNSLDEKERLVLVKRFGLTGGIAATLQEIGQQLHITRERVRQLEVRALEKLRRAAARDRLEDYFQT